MMDDFVDDIFSDPFFAQECEFKNVSGEKRILICVVQPASNNDLQILPEGDRYNPTVRVMTQEPIEPKELFYWSGHRWRIIDKSPWSDYGYYDTLATRYEGSQTSDSGGFPIT
ncbi:hypothetical protein AB7W40_21465 [Providencia rettgeri]|uniref:hypothetical protein n=1 Tax=Providencia rettgeri TaxID=587 RepID=UPI001C232557|nr:hypothetical protein I6L80_15190 [Providencia rettgeri]QXB07897.1 hypothetical protein I6L80_21370 [Providencia rettgeri]